MPVLRKSTRPTVKVPLTFEQLLFGIRQLSGQERATLEILLEKDFAKETLKRAEELETLRRKGKLLTLERLKNQLAS